MSCWYIIYIYIWLWPRQLTTDQLPHWPFVCDMCCLDEFCIKSVKLLSGKIYSEEENSSWDTSFVFKTWYRKILAANRESELWDPFQLYQFFGDSFSNVSFPVERNWKSAQSHFHHTNTACLPSFLRSRAGTWHCDDIFPLFFFMHLSFYFSPAACQ